MISFSGLNCITDVPSQDLLGKRVLLRLDFNVPIKNGRVENGYRIKSSLPTLEFLVEAGARVIVVSHAGDKNQSLKPMVEYLNQFIPAKFYPSLLDRGFEKNQQDGQIVVLENLRSSDLEEKNDQGFSQDLSELADLYVNEAFSSSHRAHASIVGLPRFLPSFVGPLFKKEVEELSKVFHPASPFLFILGGAKFSTKIPLLKKFLKKADKIFIGGALAHSLFLARGLNVGQSLLDKEEIDLSEFLNNKKIITPIDVVVKNDDQIINKKVERVLDEDIIFDAGEESTKLLSEEIKKAKFILWNGPLGNFEQDFDKATLAIAQAVAESPAHSVVGGGDTVASIAELGLEHEFGFVSTAGGAMLEFLSSETLPGIEAILDSGI